MFWPGKFHGQRRPGATVHGVAESDATEHACAHAHTLSQFVESPPPPPRLCSGPRPSNFRKRSQIVFSMNPGGSVTAPYP